MRKFISKSSRIVLSAMLVSTICVPAGAVSAAFAQDQAANQSSTTAPTPPSGGGSSNQPGGQGGSGGGANTQSFDYSGTYSGVLTASNTTKTSANQSLSTTTKDQNVVLAQNGGTAIVTGATITKSGDDSDGDTCNFYGVNSSVLAVGSGSTVNIADSSISSSSVGSNGIFATDSGTVNANNCTITTTTGGNSRGLDATYAGTIVANKMTISTAKDHCAAVATDRGGGYVSISNSNLKTAGSGSPLLYSTGDIEADNVTGTATGSQIAGMEGLNIIRINDSNLASTNDAISGSDPIKDGVIIYQSTSGDADTSTSSASDFEVSDSTLSTSITSGAMFYITNTTANVVLKNTTLSFDTSKVELLHASGNTSNNWGSYGSNGGTVTFTGIGQTLAGTVYVDSTSSAVLYLTNGSTWTGSVASSNTSGDGTTAAPANATVNVDGTSTWVVSGDTTVGTLNVANGGKVVDSTGKTATIANSAGTVLVQGTGSVIVTVSGTYGTTIGSGAGSISGASSTLTSTRASFDTLYGTTTAWGANEGASTGSDSSSTNINTDTDTDSTSTNSSTTTVTKAAQSKAKIATAKKTVKGCKKGKLKKNKTFKLTSSGVKGNAKVTWKKVSVSKKAKKYIKMASNGKVTVKKGLKKGTYKVKVQMKIAATSGYYAKTLTKTITIKVK